jgi:uncharacterized membrane protein/uncharacterized RDD family membrane protein YckC
MQLVNDIQALELLIRFGLPLLILAGLILGYLRVRAREFLKSCSLDIRVIALLTIGAITTSFINIPVFFGRNTLFAVNLGGVIIPIVLSGIFIYKLRLNPIITIISVLIISLLSNQLSYIDPDSGFFMNFPWLFIPILVSVLIAFVIYNHQPKLAVPYAYSISTFGMLIGVDITRLPLIIENELSIGYLGGNGIFDLVFISGLFALAISLPIVYFRLPIKKIDLNNQPFKIINKILVAPLKKRVIAFIIDFAIQALIFGIIIIFLLLFHADLDAKDLFSGILGFSIFWWAVFIHLLYFTIFELNSGQSFGKRLQRIKVVKLDADKLPIIHQTRPIDFLGAFTRNILRITDLVLFIISLYYFFSTPMRQRLGDIFAESVVIDIDRH